MQSPTKLAQVEGVEVNVPVQTRRQENTESKHSNTARRTNWTTQRKNADLQRASNRTCTHTTHTENTQLNGMHEDNAHIVARCRGCSSNTHTTRTAVTRTQPAQKIHIHTLAGKTHMSLTMPRCGSVTLSGLLKCCAPRMSSAGGALSFAPAVDVGVQHVLSAKGIHITDTKACMHKQTRMHHRSKRTRTRTRIRTYTHAHHDGCLVRGPATHSRETVRSSPPPAMGSSDGVSSPARALPAGVCVCVCVCVCVWMMVASSGYLKQETIVCSFDNNTRITLTNAREP